MAEPKIVVTRRIPEPAVEILREAGDVWVSPDDRPLEVFLRCERNRVKAAEELFIHYNTLRYRLGQIDQLTGGLSGDSTARLNLELALCAHRLVLGREEA